MTFNYDLITQPKTVVHCRTEEQAKELLRFMYDKGMEWCSGKSLNETKYDKYTTNTCYNFNSGSYNEFSPTAYYSDNGYNILSYEEALLKENTMQFKVNDEITYTNGSKGRIICTDAKDYINPIISETEEGKVIKHCIDGTASILLFPTRDYASSYDIVMPWQPTKGEWCWFWSDNMPESATLAKFSHMHGERYVLPNTYGYSHCAKFEGTLPPHLKEEK